MPSPFAPSTSHPGRGVVEITHQPPTIRTLSYQYPLKLIAPAPQTLHTPCIAPARTHNDTNEGDSTPLLPRTIHTLYLLSYGGGLVAGDNLDLTLTLRPHTRLLLLSQGSTKIFAGAEAEGKAAALPSNPTTTRQTTHFHLHPGSALLWLPDPVQPFARSRFAQEQRYELVSPSGGGKPKVGEKGGEKVENEEEEEPGPASLCVLDWVCEGRRARGERWALQTYASRNEVWAVGAGSPDGSEGSEGDGQRRSRLILRDNLHLDAADAVTGGVRGRMDGLGVFGSLILSGPVFGRVGRWFVQEFGMGPRMGERRWDGWEKEEGGSERERWRTARLRREKADGVVWSAAAVRGLVLVKFGAREVEGGKAWLSDMLQREGTVEREFGERALLCLR